MFDFTLEPGKKQKKRYNTEKIKPYISIITAFYNAGQYFEQTYNSVINQTFPYFEWIIVNDGSTKQEDVELLYKLAQKEKRIKILSQENGGAPSARNKAIEYMNTEIAVILDADDLIEKTQLECLYWALITNPEAQWAYSSLVAFGKERYLWKKEFSSEREKKENILIVHAAIRKKALISVGMYSEITKIYNEDWHLYLKMLAKGYRPAQINTFGFWYRINDNGNFMQCMEHEERRKRNEEIIKEAVEEVPDGIRAITFGREKPQEFCPMHCFEWNEKLEFLDKRIHVLLVVPHLVMGGADKFNLDLVKNLDKTKYEIGVITTTVDENTMLQEFSKYVDDIFELDKFLKASEWSAFIEYYIKSRAVDILFNISSYYTYYLLPWLRLRYPNLVIMDYMHADAQYWRNGGYTRVSSAFDDVIEKTIVANQATLDIMKEKYQKDFTKCEISYIGTDETYFNPQQYEFGTIRKQYQIEKERPVILFLSRLSQEKRPILMLRIAKKLKKQFPDICFFVVGDGECKEKMADKIKEWKLEKNIIMVGAKKEVRPYYRDADLFLITSIKEGLTLTTFEAMAMELPVISSDVGSQYEIVNDRTGALIPLMQDERKDFYNEDYSEEEIDAYVDALTEYLKNRQKRKNTGKSNRRLIIEKYSISKSIQQIEQIWENSLSQREYIDAREQCMAGLAHFPKMVEELACMYNNYEGMSQVADELWIARNYFKEAYEKSKQRLDEMEREKKQEIQELVMRNDLASKRLEEIYRMRSWKLMMKYQNFVRNNKIGRFIRRLFVR